MKERKEPFSFGIGPRIVVTGVLFWELMELFSKWMPSFARIPFCPKFITILGNFLIVSGILLWIGAFSSLLFRHKKGELVRKGPFRFTRNPMYFSLIFLIAPGLSFHERRWPLLVASVAMYICCLRGIRREEEELKKRYGKAYDEYLHEVPLFLPKFSSWKKQLTGLIRRKKF